MCNIMINHNSKTTKLCERYNKLCLSRGTGAASPPIKKSLKAYIADIRNNYYIGLLQKCLVCEDSLKCEDFNASEIINS